ncbi:hypothetical protein JCM19236_6464 [Vibrio sp. JCM 19236]|nr:hypothetical protein JCM19236_6464 [Vibrio sp. JCM 19236]
MPRSACYRLASGGAVAKESNQKPDIYDNENKHVDDPTRIVTRLGLGSDYNFESEQMATPLQVYRP